MVVRGFPFKGLLTVSLDRALAYCPSWNKAVGVSASAATLVKLWLQL